MGSPVTLASRVPRKTLDGADANGSGQGVDVGGYSTLAVQTVLTGSPTGGTSTLELSLDGTNWWATSTVFTIGTDDSGDIQHVTDSPAQYARATLAGLTGGTSPTVTVLISGS